MVRFKRRRGQKGENAVCGACGNVGSVRALVGFSVNVPKLAKAKAGKGPGEVQGHVGEW